VGTNVKQDQKVGMGTTIVKGIMLHMQTPLNALWKHNVSLYSLKQLKYSN